MPRPLLGMEKARGVCTACGDMVIAPPGVYYEGELYCKGCARLRAQVDFGDEVVEPAADRAEEALNTVLANMNPMSEG